MRNVFIILGVLTVTLLLLAWVYLLLFGAPKNVSELVTDWRFAGLTEERPDIVFGEDSRVALDDGALNQLTTRPIAGFEAIVSTSTNSVFYSERGTGHVYKIDLDSGREERVSGTTISKSVGSIFSDDANWVVQVSEDGLQTKSSLYQLNSNGAQLVSELPIDSDNWNFTENQLLFTTKENGRLAAYEYDLLGESTNLRWSIPLEAVDVIWNENGDSVVTKSAPYLKGNIYRVVGGDLQIYHQGFYAFTAWQESENFLWETYYLPSDKRWLSRQYAIETQDSAELPILTLPNKCAGAGGEFWCAAPIEDRTDRNLLKDWQMGTVTFDDKLWQISTNEGAAYLAKDFSADLGFVMDVENMTMGDDGRSLFFTNKINDTLWWYQIPTPEPELVAEDEVATSTNEVVDETDNVVGEVREAE